MNNQLQGSTVVFVVLAVFIIVIDKYLSLKVLVAVSFQI